MLYSPTIASLLAFAALLILGLPPSARAAEPYDVVIYGGTAGGVMSAIAIAQRGGRALVVEPTDHVGGMVTAGLGWTDRGIEQTIGGRSRQFCRRAYDHYSRPSAWKQQSREAYLGRVPRQVNHDDGVWW